MLTLNNTLEPTDFDAPSGYLVTEAGLEALRTAVIVPDDLEDTEDAPDVFTPDTEAKADWVLGKIADARTRAARIRENAELIAREQDRQAEMLEWKFGPALQDFARRELAGGKKKSIRLFNGVIGYRTKPGSVSVTDETAALTWARENAPEAVTERLDKRALADTLKASGEIVTFAQFSAPEEVFYIKQG